MSTTTTHLHVPAIAMPSLRAPLATLRTWVQRARKRARDRDALALLTDRDLRDFAADRWTIGRELSKPFWRG